MGERDAKAQSALLILLFAGGLVVGGLGTYYVAFRQISALKDEVSNLEAQVSELWGNQTVNIYNYTLYQNSTALSELYENVKDSIVLITGSNSTDIVQGSGFIYNFSGTMVVITNNHVVQGTVNNSVTFSDGDAYAATINGTDPYSDLAVLLINAPQNELKPLEVVSSSTLKVGDPVVAIGNPYGLVGSMTTGVISALGRTITEQEYAGGFPIANIIQTSAPINPGNSGGPLLNYLGKVIGITTAIVQDSQGLGFAVPSNTILKEIHALITTGSYGGHSYLGLQGADMDYDRAQQLGVNVTYGWEVVGYLSPSPAHDAGVLVGDIVIAMNGSRIRNGDDMSSYLEQNTLPTETVITTVRRGVQTVDIPVVLGKRP